MRKFIFNNAAAAWPQPVTIFFVRYSRLLISTAFILVQQLLTAVFK